jgi:uncharacterized YigZ family protein
MKDFYKTILQSKEGPVYKDKGSRFIGYTFPVTHEREIALYLEKIKKQHHKARHWCYAWKLGKQYENYRVNDDGEPSGSAGLPIYGQIQSFELTNVLVVVVRYFGGTKLGVSGLINAYKTASQEVLKDSKIITKTIDDEYLLIFAYADLDKVLKLLHKSPAKVLSQKMEMNCEYHISIRKSESEKLIKQLKELRCVSINAVD